MIALPAILQRGGEWFEISSSVSSPESCDRDRALDLLRRLTQEPGNAAILHRILAECDHTTYPYAPSHLLQTLAHRIASGRLGVQRRSALPSPAPPPVGAPGNPRPTASPPPPAAPLAPPTRTRVARLDIELIDEAGRCMAGERFILFDDKGSIVREGRLNDRGFARIDDLEPGPYQVRFPDVR